MEGTVKFLIFSSRSQPPQQESGVYLYFAEFAVADSPHGYFVLSQCEKNANAPAPAVHVLTDQYLNMALTHLYRKASSEVKKFNKEKLVHKIAVEEDQMSFAEMGDLGLSDMGIRSHVPVIDRHSPLAYSIAQHIHWNISHHRGIETCHRYSLQYCFIMQGMTLCKELADDCLYCARKKEEAC